MQYHIYIRNKAVVVTEEVYRTYWSLTEHERYLELKDTQRGTFSYNDLDTDDRQGEEIISSGRISNPVEQEVFDKLLKIKLYESIAKLDEYERNLISALFFEEKTQTQLSRETGIPQQTISFRLQKTLEKLRFLLDE